MEEILYYGSYILETIFETYVLTRVICVFLESRSEQRGYLIGACALRVVLCSVQYIYFPYLIINWMANIGTLACMVHCYQGRSVKKLTVIFICTTCEIASELIVTMIVILQNKEIDWDNPTHNGNAFTFIAIAIVLGLICEMICSFVNVHKDVMVPRLFSGSIIVLSIILYALEVAIFTQNVVTDTIRFLSLICLLFVLFLFMYLYDSLSRNYTERIQAEIIEREKNYYYRQAELLQQNSRVLSDFRHDSMNHLYALHSMLDNSAVEAKRYMEKLIGKMQDVRTYSSTGNVAVDSVINYKLSEAEQKGIEIMVQILFPEHIASEIEDIVAILGNLLDNATEAAEKAKGNRYVDFRMKCRSGVLIIYVKNSYDGILATQNGEIVTRKEDTRLHGIGLKSIRSLVEAHDGTMKLAYTDDEFEVKIMLYI